MNVKDLKRFLAVTDPQDEIADKKAVNEIVDDKLEDPKTDINTLENALDALEIEIQQNEAQRALEKEALEQRLQSTYASRVSSLDSNNVSDHIVECSGDLTYIDSTNMSQHSEYDLTESGWYAFARISAKPDQKIKSGWSIAGGKYITPSINDTHVDVAVRFGVVAQSQTVIVNWGDETESFTFKATDLAVRNLDYRVTFYQYDLEPYCTWTWGVASGTATTAKSYYKLIDGEYVKQTGVSGTLPANTYYTHTGLTISGFVKNISYVLDEIDCPVTINLPATDDNYGAWFEVQTNFLAVYSITFTAVSPDKVSAKLVHSPKAGVDIINLMYHMPTKTWLPTITNWAAGV